MDAGTAPRDIAVLVRVRSDFAAFHAALVARGVPVEVVGLGGLLSLPEVADLVAMLGVLDDPTANPAHGPAAHRPALADRPARPCGRSADVPPSSSAPSVPPSGTARRPGGGPPGAAVEGVDTAEVVSLSEAVERPGDPARYGYSAEALERFARLAAELRLLRRSLGEPLLDLLQRVIRASGLDVEVAASP